MYVSVCDKFYANSEKLNENYPDLNLQYFNDHGIFTIIDELNELFPVFKPYFKGFPLKVKSFQNTTTYQKLRGGVPSTPLPPHLYHGGGINLRVRPMVNMVIPDKGWKRQSFHQQNERFSSFQVKVHDPNGINHSALLHYAL